MNRRSLSVLLLLVTLIAVFSVGPVHALKYPPVPNIPIRPPVSTAELYGVDRCGTDNTGWVVDDIIHYWQVRSRWEGWYPVFYTYSEDFDYTAACYNHDNCPNFGHNRAYCDAQFYTELMTICGQGHDKAARSWCYGTAYNYYVAVATYSAIIGG